MTIFPKAGERQATECHISLNGVQEGEMSKAEDFRLEWVNKGRNIAADAYCVGWCEKQAFPLPMECSRRIYGTCPIRRVILGHEDSIAKPV